MQITSKDRIIYKTKSKGQYLKMENCVADYRAVKCFQRKPYYLENSFLLKRKK